MFEPRAVGQSDLTYPKDRWRILFLSQRGKEAWYAAQDPQALVASSKEFQRFWMRCYGWHVKAKRFVFKLKFW